VIDIPHVAIAHVIGTIGLLALLSIVVVISTTTSANFNASSTQSNLQEIASYVASQITSMSTLITSLPQNNFTAYKVLEFPSNIGFAGYSISLLNDSTGCKVMAYLDNNPRVNANASLNFPAYGVLLRIFDPTLPSSSWPVGSGIVNVTNVIHSGEGSSLATAKFTAVIVFRSVAVYNVQFPYIGLGVSSVGRNL